MCPLHFISEEHLHQHPPASQHPISHPDQSQGAWSNHPSSPWVEPMVSQTRSSFCWPARKDDGCCLRHRQGLSWKPPIHKVKPIIPMCDVTLQAAAVSPSANCHCERSIALHQELCELLHMAWLLLTSPVASLPTLLSGDTSILPGIP